MAKSNYDIKLVTKWTPPSDDDLRPLIAMVNLPKPQHGLAPRTLLGASTWNHMRKRCYAEAGFKCEICGAEVGVDIEKRQLHAHEIFQIDYERGVSTFIRCAALCSLCHLGCIHTGRAYTLHRRGNPLYPKEFLLEGAEHAFKIITAYNKDHPGADLRAYQTFIDYLKCDDLKDEMEKLIKKYNMKFYSEDPKKTAKWKDWRLVIGTKEYPTPYENEKAWKKAMEEAGKNDSARIMQKNMEERFSGGVYDELNALLKDAGEKTLADFVKPKVDDDTAEIVRAAIKASRKDQEDLLTQSTSI